MYEGIRSAHNDKSPKANLPTVSCGLCLMLMMFRINSGDVVSMAIGSIGMIGMESGIVGNAYGACHSYTTMKAPIISVSHGSASRRPSSPPTLLLLVLPREYTGGRVCHHKNCSRRVLKSSRAVFGRSQQLFRRFSQPQGRFHCVVLYR